MTYTHCGNRSRAKNASKTGKTFIRPVTPQENANIIMKRLGITSWDMRQLYKKLTKDGLPGKFIAI